MKIRENHLKKDKFYHIFNRGINSKLVFLNNENSSFFLRKVEKYILPNFSIYAYCLMPNHFHFILKPKNIEELSTNYQNKGLHSEEHIFSKTVGKLISSYTQAFNKVYQRSGALFESPFKRIEIKDEDYLRKLIIYIHKNPKNYKNYKFSSYKAILSEQSSKLQKEEVLNLFGSIENFIYCHENEVSVEKFI